MGSWSQKMLDFSVRERRCISKFAAVGALLIPLLICQLRLSLSRCGPWSFHVQRFSNSFRDYPKSTHLPSLPLSLLFPFSCGPVNISEAKPIRVSLFVLLSWEEKGSKTFHYTWCISSIAPTPHEFTYASREIALIYACFISSRILFFARYSRSSLNVVSRVHILLAATLQEFSRKG